MRKMEEMGSESRNKVFYTRNEVVTFNIITSTSHLDLACSVLIVLWR